MPSDPESLSPLGVRWCTIDAYDDVPVAHAVRRREVVYLPTLDDLNARAHRRLLGRFIRYHLGDNAELLEQDEH